MTLHPVGSSRRFFFGIMNYGLFVSEAFWPLVYHSWVGFGIGQFRCFELQYIEVNNENCVRVLLYHANVMFCHYQRSSGNGRSNSYSVQLHP